MIFLSVKASIHRADEAIYEFLDVAPLAWGTRFHDQDWVSKPVMELIAERGGHI